jgi:ATP-dependent DNA ligase
MVNGQLTDSTWGGWPVIWFSTCCYAPADSGFIYPCLPSPAEHPPSGPGWLHEVKHDGFRVLARRDVASVRLFTRNGIDWSERFPLIVQAVGALKARSCLIDGEAIGFAIDQAGAHPPPPRR